MFSDLPTLLLLCLLRALLADKRCRSDLLSFSFSALSLFLLEAVLTTTVASCRGAEEKLLPLLRFCKNTKITNAIVTTTPKHATTTTITNTLFFSSRINEPVGDSEGNELGEKLADGFVVGIVLGKNEKLGESLGNALGIMVTVGDEVGLKLGDNDILGKSLGTKVGKRVGASVGAPLGAWLSVGDVVGTALGLTDLVGISVG